MMRCESVQERLSAYVDNEVNQGERATIEKHLDGCETCRAQLSQYLALGNLMRQSEAFVDTEAVWQRVVVRLDENSKLTLRTNSSRKWVYAVLATAASLLIVGFAVSVLYNNDHSEHGHASLAVDFQDVFRAAQTDPQASIAKLVAKYQGQELSQPDTISYLGYEPALFQSLPDGFARVSTHVLNMPCCKCSATICERSDGTSLVVFEHKEKQPIWFGDADSIETQCAGKTCKIVESAGQLAVSWKNADRQLTLFGVNDLSEVKEWIESMKL